MKKAFLLLILPLFFGAMPLARAGECEKISEVPDYYVKVVSGVNIRDQVCEGQVIGALSAGTVVKVLGEIEGWRYIERPDGGKGFIWSDFVENTSVPASAPAPTAAKEPLYDIKGHPYETAIRYLAEKKIVQGYPDGSFLPDKTMNRAEFVKILLGAKLAQAPAAPLSPCFSDLTLSDWHAPFACYAKSNGILSGYSDGSFGGAKAINVAEAAKILVNTWELPKSPDLQGAQWYQAFIETLQKQSYLPSSVSSVNKLVTRGEMAEMVWRIMGQIHDKPAATISFDALSCIDKALPDSIDMAQVRDAWLGWVNQARSGLGRDPYAYHDALNHSATRWSEENEASGTGKMTHQRPGTNGYYDYYGIKEWFTALGVEFAAGSGTVYSENIGWGPYSCSETDCTEKIKAAAKLIFDAFMAEKGTSYTAHYDTVVSPDFKITGLGIAVDETLKRFYLTTHYAKGIAKEPNYCG